MHVLHVDGFDSQRFEKSAMNTREAAGCELIANYIDIIRRN